MKSITSVGITVISSFLLICHFWSFVTCDPCLNAVYIGDSRRSVAYAATARDPMLCDVNINETLWYRFDAHTGGKMPESCVAVLRCGTFLPIWMNDTHPTAADPGPKSAKVCATFWRRQHANCCQWKETISVRWCQNSTSRKDYFVYQLKKPPICSMSYCAGDGMPCETGCAWNGVRNSCTCPAYPDVTEAPELKPPRVISGPTRVTDMYDPGRTFFPTKFVVDCEVKYPRKTVDDGARFDVVFEIDGRYLTHFTVDSINPVATLDEAFLIGHLGKELTCKVSSHWDSSDVGSRYLISNRRWFGLNPVDKTDSVVSSNLVVKEGEKVSLWMKPTFPITTRPCFDAPLEPCLYSSYRFTVSAAENVQLSDCQMVFHDNSSRSVELEIAPIPAVGTTPKPIIWQLNFEAYSDATLNLPMQDGLDEQSTPIFKDYRIQSVNIEVRNADVPPQCESTGDPHITTFPNAAGARNFYHVYGVGDFYLVRLQSRLLEIQVRHVPCGDRYSCTCGVIVREGNSIIGVTKCNQATPLLIKYELDKVSPTGTIHSIPEGWKISLLSGIVIKVTGFWGEYMHLYVTGLKSELTQYDGLCSATNLAWNSECTSDCDRYRVPAAQTFFNVNQNTLPQCGTPFFVPKCRCYGRDPHGTRTGDSIKIACEDPSAGDYLLRIDLTKVCRRHKRQTDGEDDGDSMYDDYISLDDFNNNPIPISTTTTTTTATTTTTTTTTAAIIRRPPAPSGNNHPLIGAQSRTLQVDGNRRHMIQSVDRRNILSVANYDFIPVPTSLSVEDGRRRCQESLRLSPTYGICSSRVNTSAIVNTCALDVQLMNDYGPSKSVPTEFEIACIGNIRRSIDSYTSSSDLSGFEELKNLLTRVEKSVCPSQCSQHGSCVDSKCQCNAGFMGSDCSLRIGQAPVIRRIFSPLCNIRKHPCTQIHLVASDLTIPENVVCKMRSVNNFGGAVPAVQYSTPVISGGLVLCNLPSMVVNVNESSNGISTTTFLVQVSISNDGQTYSQEVPFTILDGHCMDCPASQNAPCQLKANTCSIGGRCYRAEESCPRDATKICNPAKCTTRWTTESSTNCNDGFESCI